MSEVEGLLALYGALDRAVEAHDVDPSDLAPLLGAYRYPEAVGWYERQYVPWVEGASARAERRGERRDTTVRRPRITVRHRSETLDAPGAAVERPTTESRIQDIHDALSALGPAVLEGRLAARRLLAVTAIARALPQHFGPGGSKVDAASNALTFRLPAEDADDEGLARRAQQLHAQFAAEFTSMDHWQNVVGNAVSSGLLPQSFLSQAQTPPCTGRLILRPTSAGGEPDPCLVMEAEFTTKDITFAAAKNYLEPSNWQYPGSLWCQMEQYQESADSTTAMFHETVSTDCGAASPAWTVSTDLQFWFSHPYTNEARAEYDLAEPPVVGSDIEIDEGSLRMIELADGSVHVITTKRVRFAGSFDGPGLALFMCASGYSSVLEDVVFSVAKASIPKPFPIPAPQGGTVTPPQSFKTPSDPAGSEGDTWESLIGEATTLAGAYAKDVAAICTTSMDQAKKGTYKVENVWADGIKIWSSYLSGMGKALDLGTRAAKVATQKPADDS
jgi:hypothetical protein